MTDPDTRSTYKNLSILELFAAIALHAFIGARIRRGSARGGKGRGLPHQGTKCKPTSKLQLRR